MKFHWKLFLVILWIIALVSQIGGQYGLFTGGINAYTVYTEYDTITHTVWEMALTGLILTFLTLPAYLDLWRYWIPILSFIKTLIWELIELCVTWFHLLPPDAMFATGWNSMKDVVIGILATCTMCFIYDLEVER
jgi:hypothetical protein